MFPGAALAQPGAPAARSGRGGVEPVIILVRHAERADAGMPAAAGADPDVSPAGRARAEALAAMLKDARITQIFVTEFKRTRQTAEPLAKLLSLEPTVITSKDTAGLVARLKTAAGNVLVVGHSNSVPAVVKALGVDEAITIADAEYDNLFVVVLGTKPSLVRLRYR
jgi:broad specificity phosphatase PhoE